MTRKTILDQLSENEFYSFLAWVVINYARLQYNYNIASLNYARIKFLTLQWTKTFDHILYVMQW